MKSLLVSTVASTMGLAASMTISVHADKIKLTFPEPYFGGTALLYEGENYQIPDYKPIPPLDVPSGTINIAKGKKVTASVEKPDFGKFSFLVDGNANYEEENVVGLPKGLQWIQIDFDKQYNIHAINLWHLYFTEAVVFDVIIQTADDAAFTKNVKTIYNNDHDKSSKIKLGTDKEYLEDYRGKLFHVKDTKTRFIRFYSNGSTHNEQNHYTEAVVYGSPIKYRYYCP